MNYEQQLKDVANMPVADLLISISKGELKEAAISLMSKEKLQDFIIELLNVGALDNYLPVH